MEFIKNIDVGDTITDFFAVRWIELRNYEGKAYIAIGLGCSKGRINATYWGEDASELSSLLNDGDVVKVQGIGTEYKNQRWLKIERMRKSKPDEIDYEKLLPRGRYSPKILWRRFLKIIDSISDKYLAELLHNLFVADDNIAKKFSIYPAAKLWHGAYIGGLCEHTIRVEKICETAASFYPDCRKELLITGALVHDIGKVEELSIRGFFDYNVRGRLIGHIVLGASIVEHEIAKIEGFPKNLSTELIHLIVSHHGKFEQGSPVEPKNLEAMILHHADMLDAQAEGIQHIIQRDIQRGEKFSEYIKILGRFIYLDGYRAEKHDDNTDEK
ncbi:HD domain-containing protein [bacterium]|nr:HD domain-containing protein [bacterium]